MTRHLTDGLDLDAVSAWLAPHLPGATSPFTYQRLTAGRSNLTFTVSDSEERSWVLRRPPLSDTAATARHLDREWAILTILDAGPVPVPAPIAQCSDPTVTGAPFYVMEHLAGLTIEDEDDADRLSAAARRTLSEQLVDTLADLHRIDCDRPELRPFTRDEPYLSRQLRQWHRQIDSAAGPDGSNAPAGLTELHRRLVAERPEERYVGIVHGDYRPGNLIVGPDGAVIGVLDWELWTVGDVLADLGWLLATWSSPEAVDWAAAQTPGFAGPDDLIARYQAQTGYDLDRVNYYHAFALWKLSCIALQALSRYRSGAMGTHDVDLHSLQAKPAALIEQAFTVLA